LFECRYSGQEEISDGSRNVPLHLEPQDPAHPRTLVEDIDCIPRRSKSIASAPDGHDEEIVLNFDVRHNSNGSPFWTVNGIQYKSNENSREPIFLQALKRRLLPNSSNPYFTHGNGTIVQLIVNNRHQLSHPSKSCSFEVAKKWSEIMNGG